MKYITIEDVETTSDLKRLYNETWDRQAKQTRFTTQFSLLVSDTDISRRTLRFFCRIASKVERRNWAIVNTKDLDRIVGTNNASKLISELEERNLIRIRKRDMVNRGDRLIQVNPAYAFRGSERDRGYYLDRWYNGV